MRLTLTLFLLAVSLSLSSSRVRQRTDGILNSTARSIDELDCAHSHKFLGNAKHIKRVQIHNQIGLDGQVRRVHLDYDEEDKPGIRAYGLPKKRLQDNGVIERLHLGKDRIDDTSRNGRLVEAYGISKNNMETNGFIERLPSSSINREPAKLESQNENDRVRRSVHTGFENKVQEKIVSEAEDMEAQDAKVFRPLFVYRHQVAARERRKHARNAEHKNHRHASHRPCHHRQVTY